MLGWLADSFRFAWALLYWNARKTWFRLRGGRPPCQTPSDSGRAYETGCDACWGWNKPARFRRVCPLLVRNKAGLCCSADAAEVRPFWHLTVRYYGGAVLGLYAAGVVAVFVLLRTIGYPVSIRQVAWPPDWAQLRQAHGWFFLTRAQRAFASGDTNAGLLYLANAYEFDPSNYDTGLALARADQIGQPARSDRIFERLIRDHPARRNATALSWFRALLARGDFKQVARLATREVADDPARANAWMRALIFATRRTGDASRLRELLANQEPAIAQWHRLLSTELLLRAGHVQQVRASIESPWPEGLPAYTLVYRAQVLTMIGHPVAAADFLQEWRNALDDETWLTLQLDCLASAGAQDMVRREVRTYLLGPPLNQPRLKVACAQLIRHPDIGLFEEVYGKVAQRPMPLDSETAGGWFSLLCTAGAVGDKPRLHQLTLQLRAASRVPFAALPMVEAFFNGSSPDHRATSFLPYLPLPLEVSYALIERYPADRGSATGR